MDQVIYLAIPILLALCCVVFISMRQSEHSREISYLKKQVSSLQDDCHKNWLNTRNVAHAAGLEWVPKEEGKWVKK